MLCCQSTSTQRSINTADLIMWMLVTGSDVCCAVSLLVHSAVYSDIDNVDVSDRQ